MEVEYDRRRARAHPKDEENEIEVSRPNPCVALSEAYGAEEWVARSLINTAALPSPSLVLFFYYSTFAFNLSLHSSFSFFFLSYRLL
jgi:hypothetical protein